MTRTTPSRWPWHILPTALLAFMLASPVFSLPPTPTTNPDSSYIPRLSRETQPPTSANDPFRALSLQIPKRPDPPVCCLKKKESLEGVGDEDDLLLISFEEWKARQQQVLVQQVAQHQQNQDSQRRDGVGTGVGSSSGSTGNVGVGTGGNGSGAVNGHNIGGNGNGVGHGTGPASDGGDSSSSEGANLPPDLSALSNENGAATANVPIGTPDDNSQPPSYESLSPHFRVPLTDRFNYASLDCSARVHTAHKLAKSPANILSSKKDRYMLSPCRGRAKKDQNQFVVVELCEDIRIDTVQLANFEFFSGVFKDFSVSVAKTYTTDLEGWVPAGTYRAKNVRGIQSFHPPTSLRDFYRYIRLDFHSHYGTEYYCPVSLLRVYGLTHLEEYKWEMWETESKARLVELANAADFAPIAQSSEVMESSSQQEDRETSPPFTGAGNVLPATFGEPVPPKPSYEDPTTSTVKLASTPSMPLPSAEAPSTASPIMEGFTEPSNPGANSAHVDLTAPRKSAGIASGIRDLIVSSTLLSSKSTISTASQIKDKEAASTGVVTTAAPTSSKAASASGPSAVSSAPGGQHAHSHVHGHGGHPHQHAHGQAASTHTPLAVPVNNPPMAPPLPPAGGESIYKIIMNRLSALEMNHTLYVRYAEQQTNGMKEVLKRLKEEIGRVEAIGRAQGQTLQKSMREWERQRFEIQREYGELRSKVDYLRDEIILEKRLSIAQLCLLLTVLVFMGLTRGSRGGDSVPQQLLPEPVEVHSQARKVTRSGGGRRRVRNLSGSDWGRLVPGWTMGTGITLGEAKLKARRNVRLAPLNFSVDGVQFPQAGDTESEAPDSPLDRNIVNLSHQYDRPRSQPSGQRSRTPSTRSPTSRLLPYQRPVTPTSSAFPRMHLQRSNSLHSSGPGSGVLQTTSSGAGGKAIVVGHGVRTPASTVVMLNTPAWSGGGPGVNQNGGGAANMLSRSVLMRRGGAAYSAHLHEMRRGKVRRNATAGGGGGTSLGAGPAGHSNVTQSEEGDELFEDYYGNGAGYDTPTKKKVKGKTPTISAITATGTSAASRGRTGARGNGSDVENEDVFLYATTTTASSPSRSTSRSRGRGGDKGVPSKLGRSLRKQNAGLAWGVGTPVSENKKKGTGGPGEADDMDPVLGVVGRGIGRVNDEGGVHVDMDVVDPDVDADADNWTTEGSAD